MSESSVSPSTSSCKMLAFFLLFALVGVYVLYEWYDDRLYAQLAGKDALIAESNRQLKEMDARRLASEEGRSALGVEIQALKERHRAERQDLASQIESLEQARSGLGQDLEGLKAEHAAALAAEQGKTAEVAAEKDGIAATLAETQSLYQAEQATTQVLRADLDKVHEAIADAVTEHQARVADLERHINERVTLARTSPGDADLLKTATEMGILPSTESRAALTQEVSDELAGAKAALASLQAEHEATRARLAETQAELERALEEDQSVAETDQEPDIQARLDDLNSRLLTEREVRTALQKQHEAAIAALKDSLSEREARLATAESGLEAARTAAARLDEESSQLADAGTRIQSLESSLEEARARAEQTQAALREQLAEANARLASAETRPEPAVPATAEPSPADIEALASATARIQALETELNEARSQARSEEAAGGQDLAAELAQLRALQAGFAELNGTYTDRGLLVRLAEAELSFPAGKATLPETKLASLDRIAALLSEQAALSVRIEGHTDSLGGDDLNLTLSRQRAEAVKQALSDRGVAAERLSAEGIGSARPIANNATAEGRSKNRRVEVYLID
ncbi:OmpA family protein [Thiocystis violacea]|uniref:OmpA family protein n=1 Tax=Thiocystis violacea TaxID=13725 RepID=UPI001905398F|nr:OmpA family protein [Thiocystis violacea]